MRPFFAAIILSLLGSSFAFSQVPRTISYQGTLVDSKTGIGVSGKHLITASLYDTKTGMTVLYSKTDSVAISRGVFNVLLDSIPATVLFDRQMYLGVSIDGQPEIDPRTPLTSSPYALGASNGIASITSKDSTVRIKTFSGGKVDLSVTTTAPKGSVSWANITGIPSTFPPGGTASGDLSGSYPSPILIASGVTPGTYTNPTITVDVKGRVTSATTTATSLTLPYSGLGNSLLEFEIRNLNTAAHSIGIRGEANSTTSSFNPHGAGVVGENLSASTVNSVFGTVGRVNSSFLYSAGVCGFDNAGASGNGVMGVGYNGVLGYTNSPAPGAAGLYGFAQFSSAYSGYFSGGKGLYVNGDQTATGVKSAVVPIGNEWRKLYCEEAAEVYFTDYGSAQLVNGRCHVDLDPIFLQSVTIDNPHSMKVFVEMNGETNGVFVEKHGASFDVVENGHGTSNASFDYRIVAKRKGYEDRRMEIGNAPDGGRLK